MDLPPLLMSYSGFGVPRVVDLPPLPMTYSRIGVPRVDDLPPLSEHDWGACSRGLTPSRYNLLPNWGSTRSVCTLFDNTAQDWGACELAPHPLS